MFLFMIIAFIVNAYILVIIAQVVMGWLIAFDIVNEDNEAAVNLMALLWKLTDPVFSKVRKYVPPISGMDFTPLIVIIALQVLTSILFGI